MEQIENYAMCLNIKNAIDATYSGYNGAKAHRIQFSDSLFHEYLGSIGIYPAKSKTVKEIIVPPEYFFDFLRGCFDGDGSFYSYWDPRYRSSHMYYVQFVSASEKHINWLRTLLSQKLGVKGSIGTDGRKSTYQLKYAKREALEIIRKMYYSPSVVCLSRKKLKIQQALEIEDKQQMRYKKNIARVMKLVDMHP